MRSMARSSFPATLAGSDCPAHGGVSRTRSSAHRTVVHPGMVVVVGDVVPVVRVVVVAAMVLVVVGSSGADTTTNSLNEKTRTTISFAVRSQQSPPVQGPGIRSTHWFVMAAPSL